MKQERETNSEACCNMSRVGVNPLSSPPVEHIQEAHLSRVIIANVFRRYGPSGILDDMGTSLGVKREYVNGLVPASVPLCRTALRSVIPLVESTRVGKRAPQEARCHASHPQPFLVGRCSPNCVPNCDSDLPASFLCALSPKRRQSPSSCRAQSGSLQ